MVAERRGLGWQRDFRKAQDYKFTAPAAQPLPPSVTLWTPPIVDQGPTNSCVGNATASLFRYTLHHLGMADFQPSRLFNYWYARKISHLGWESEDEGAMPRDAMQSMISNGCVPEDEWPFDPAHVNDRPSQGLLPKAYKHRIVEGQYVRMLANDNLYHLKYSLAQGLPFLVGIDVYSSFYDTRDDGLVPMPQTSETYEGGHLIYCNGYDDSVRRFRCPNSWSEDWGDNGIGWLPYEYVANAGLSGDFWAIRLLT